jgi:hypothetical protein
MEITTGIVIEIQMYIGKLQNPRIYAARTKLALETTICFEEWQNDQNEYVAPRTIGRGNVGVRGAINEIRWI